MKKRALFSLASIAAAACLACGCGGGGGGSVIILDGVNRTQASTVSVFGNRSDRYSLSVVEDTLQKFMSENIIATYESARDVDYWQALDKRFATGNLDDIFWVERDRLLTMTRKGALADISGVVNLNIFNDFARSQLYGADGNIYAVPTAISTYGLYVNYDLLENNGFKAKVPTNFENFKAICEYFKGDTAPIICNNYSSLSSLILATGLYDTYCNANTASELKKYNADPTLLAEPLYAGIDFVYQLIDSGWIDIEKAAQTTYSGESELFASGDYPFMIAGGWLSDTLEEKFNFNFKYGIYPFPVPERESILVAQADLLSVKKGTNEKEAKALVSLLTRSDTLLLLNNNQSRFSPLRVTNNNASVPLTPSAYSLYTNKYVVSADVRLRIPLDGYLSQCTDLILFEHADAATVKSCLYDLLSRGSADE